MHYCWLVFRDWFVVKKVDDTISVDIDFALPGELRAASVDTDKADLSFEKATLSGRDGGYADLNGACLWGVYVRSRMKEEFTSTFGGLRVYKGFYF